MYKLLPILKMACTFWVREVSLAISLLLVYVYKCSFSAQIQNLKAFVLLNKHICS